MTTHRARPLHPIAFLRALRARPRLLGCGIVGLAVWMIGQALGFDPAVMALVGWNVGAGLFMVLAWRLMRSTTVEGIRDRALKQDEGRLAILLVVVLAAVFVLLAAGTQLAKVKDLHGRVRDLHLALDALTVITSWLFTQVLFALHYAHDFYMARIVGQPDPLKFPGTMDPEYGDFFHFSCVIGVACQTADIAFIGSALRPVGTLHCVMAFFFNATLLALSINLAAGLLL